MSGHGPFAGTEAYLCHSCLSYLLLLTVHALIDRLVIGPEARVNGARKILLRY
jgi:hypothetical protein